MESTPRSLDSGAPPHLNIKLLGHVKQNFPPSIRKEILRVAEQKPLAPGEFSQLHARLGNLYADAALSACKKLAIFAAPRRSYRQPRPNNFHRGAPVNFLGARIASTLQIGDGSVIAALTASPRSVISAQQTSLSVDKALHSFPTSTTFSGVKQSWAASHSTSVA